jgi:uncharacterized membrane protein
MISILRQMFNPPPAVDKQIQTSRQDNIMIYGGVGILLLGAAVFILTAFNIDLQTHLALAVAIWSVGVVMSYVGLRARPDKTKAGLTPEGRHSNPLRNLLPHPHSGPATRAEDSGSRALGFVLVAIGSFILGLPGLWGLIFLQPTAVPLAMVTYATTPLFAFGLAVFVFGILLRRR